VRPKTASRVEAAASGGEPTLSAVTVSALMA
jgi:hypothetical protein